MKWILAPDLYYLAVVGLAQIIQWFPVPLLRRGLTRSAALAAYHLSRDKRRRAETSLARWRGAALHGRDRRRIVRRMLYDTWREIFCWSEFDPGDREQRGVEIHGFEHLRQALAAGKGAILWESNSFGPRMLAKAVLRSRGIDLQQIHGADHLGGFLVRDSAASIVRETAIRRFFDRQELRIVDKIIRLPPGNSLAHLKPLIESLAQNAVLCVSGDGRVGRRLISRPLLGHSVPFATGAASLSRLSGAPLVPMFCFEQAGGKAVLSLGPPIDMHLDASREQSTERAVQQFVDTLAGYVERYPGQYRNWHLLAEGERRGVETVASERRERVACACNCGPDSTDPMQGDEGDESR